MKPSTVLVALLLSGCRQKSDKVTKDMRYKIQMTNQSMRGFSNDSDLNVQVMTNNLLVFQRSGYEKNKTLCTGFGNRFNDNTRTCYVTRPIEIPPDFPLPDKD